MLFRPGRIGTLRVANRVIKSPQTTALSNQDGTVSERLVNHYKRLAEGGPGLIIVEYSYVDDDASKSIHAQLGISRREHIAGLGRLVDEVHAAGSKVGIQLEHCGRQKFLGVQPIKTASDVSWDVVEGQYGERPQVMTTEEIDAVVTSFGDAAVRAGQARFDLVEVHAGHGYLITNFLSPHTNKRRDDYGGTFENRTRLLRRIIEDIRAKIPPTMPLSVRLSVTDYEADGIPVTETVELCRILERLGVDVIHASGGHHARMEYEVSPWFMPRAPHRDGWEQIRQAVTIPVIASGSLVSPLVAAEIVATGSADFVSLGRAMLADPDWTLKARQGRLLDIVPCIRCNDGCLHRGLNVGRGTGCTVNPGMGAEYRFPIQPTTEPKRVAVVGGGPAGLRASDVLAQRGHDVTLYEKRQLGGRLLEATRFTGNEDLEGLLRHLVHRVENHDGVRIVAEQATAEQLAAEDYATVYIATGSRPRPFPGAVDHPRFLHAVEAADHHLPGPVVVIGGGLTGSSYALGLARSGVTNLTIVDQEPALLSHDEVFTDAETLPRLLSEHGVLVRTGTRAVSVDANGVTVEHSGGTEMLPAHTVVWAGGYVGDPTLADALHAADPKIDVLIVGGARVSGRIFDALHESFFSARLC